MKDFQAIKLYKIILAAFFALSLIGCGAASQPKAETPTDVLRKFVEASQKKDVATIKQTLSSGTLKMIEASAQKENITLDDALRRDDGTLKEMPETRGEAIEGETATVEVKNAATADWDKIPFVREEGKWKIALDKFMQELMKKYTNKQ